MRFIDEGHRVHVQIAYIPGDTPRILADFRIAKPMFQEFLEHMEAEIKKAYQREELFPSVKKDE